MNAGLRGHQFVKEGAEDVLESGDLLLRDFDLCFQRDEWLRNRLLVLKRRRNGNDDCGEASFAQNRDRPERGEALPVFGTVAEDEIDELGVSTFAANDRVDLLIRRRLLPVAHADLADA